LSPQQKRIAPKGLPDERLQEEMPVDMADFIRALIAGFAGIAFHRHDEGRFQTLAETEFPRPIQPKA
jgi:hypothetical protein